MHRARRAAVPPLPMTQPLRIVFAGTPDFAVPPLDALHAAGHRLVADVSQDQDHPLAFVNPEIIEREGTTEAEEGCLSVPGIFDKLTTRSARIVVRALDRDGKPFELEADGLLAVCIQHEMDHLEGKLFVDYLSELKRSRIRKKLEKDRRERGSAPAAHERSKAPVI